MAASAAPGWFTSSFSGGSGNGCIEVAFLPDGTVGVRDTKDRTRTALSVPTAAWATFVSATRAGTFGPQPDCACAADLALAIVVAASARHTSL